MKGEVTEMKKSREMLAHVILSGLTEICAIVVFGALAYYFKHWWIALFSLLYTFTYSERSTVKQENEKENEHE